MRPIYMTHEDHGVHIAYDEAEIERCKVNGWVVFGDKPPGAKSEAITAVIHPTTLTVTKRKYARKAA